LVEFKTGTACLDAEQINTYWDVARERGFDAVVTISNEIAPSADSHPTQGLRVRANSKVRVHHLSWTALLSTAVMIKSHRGVDDPEQAWILGELIRYLRHPASGAMAFKDMGPNWVGVRTGARDGTLRASDSGVEDVALRWDQLLRYASLLLGAKIGADVEHVLPRAHSDQCARTAYLVDALMSGAPLDGTLRVPNAVGDIEVAADIKAGRISASVAVPSPDDRGARGRCSWIVRELRDAPPSLMIEAYARYAREPIVATLAQATEDHSALLDDEKREPTKFRLVYTVEMGVGRKSGTRAPGFIDSVLTLIESFYGSVVQPITPWRPKAPKISTQSTETAGERETEKDKPVDDTSPRANARA